MSITHYGTLGVARAATLDEIKEAYYALARELHPDREGGDEQKMARLNEAYNVLKNTESRELYDAQIEMLGVKCEKCSGHGQTYKQKGFTARTTIRCQGCRGEGFIAMRPGKIVTLSGTKTKKRRAK